MSGTNNGNGPPPGSLGASGPAGAGAFDIEGALRTALAHHQAGRLDEAKELYRRVLRAEPEQADALNLLGVAVQDGGDAAEAVRLIRRAIAVDGAEAHYYTNLGNALMAAGRLDEAVSAYRRGLALNPGSVIAHNNLGNVLVGLGRRQEAIESYDRALAIDPHYPSALYNLGGLLYAEEEREKALDYFQRAIRACPDDMESRFKLFLVLFELGDKQGAARHYEIWKSATGPRKSDQGTSVRILPSARMDPSADYTRKPYIHEFRDVSLLTSHWLVLEEKRIFYEELLNRNIEKVPFIKATGRDGSVFADLPEETSTLETPCVLLGGSPQYYHWMVDHLPRLSLVERSEEAAALPLLVNEDLADFQAQSLEVLGIPSDRLVKLKGPDHIRCRRLLVPTNLSHGFGWLHADGVGWLRRSFRQDTAVDDVQGGAFLYVSRRDADRRKLLNEEALIEALAPLGFEVVAPGELPFRAQLDAFSAAKLIVGPHGGGLVNMIFSPDAVRVIELQHVNYPSGYISGLAGSAGIPLKTIFGVPEGIGPFAGPDELEKSDFKIDVETVVSEVRETLREIA